MPTAPRKACSCPGCPSCDGRCPELSTGGRCPTCRPAAERAKPHDPDRKRIYNSPRWRALRRQVRQETQWCSVQGCGKLWTDLDHEPPLRDIMEQGGDPFSRENVQPLCRRHHSLKTAREVGLGRR